MLNFVDFSSKSSEGSTADLDSAKTTANSIELKEKTGKRKVLFPCNVENEIRKRKKNLNKRKREVQKLLPLCGESIGLGI